MDFTILSEVNYVAVLVSAVVFFIIGSIWFSFLFGSIWQHELKKHHVVIKQPQKNELVLKMLLTFGANVLASICMAELVVMTGSTTALSGLMLGGLVALGFAVPALGSVFIWESRSLKLFLLDVGYPALGFIATAILLSVWR